MYTLKKYVQLFLLFVSSLFITKYFIQECLEKTR